MTRYIKKKKNSRDHPDVRMSNQFSKLFRLLFQPESMPATRITSTMMQCRVDKHDQAQGCKKKIVVSLAWLEQQQREQMRGATFNVRATSPPRILNLVHTGIQLRVKYLDPYRLVILRLRYANDITSTIRPNASLRNTLVPERQIFVQITKTGDPLCSTQ